MTAMMILSSHPHDVLEVDIMAQEVNKEVQVLLSQFETGEKKKINCTIVQYCYLVQTLYNDDLLLTHLDISTSRSQYSVVCYYTSLS